MTHLFITTRYGLYRYSHRMEKPVRVLSNHDVADSRLRTNGSHHGTRSGKRKERSIFL